MTNACPDPGPDISIFRGATVWMLRRYFNASVELGRLPSIMGREAFRSRVRCRPASFESVVVYVLDVERCVQKLRRVDQELITRVVLQEHTLEEAARMVNMPVISVKRRLANVLDALSEMFLAAKLMRWPELRHGTSAPPSVVETLDALDDEISLSACAEEAVDSPADPPAVVSEDREDVRVPVEIFLSTPLLSQIPANVNVQ